jgi:hypothetical protein
MNAMKTNMHRLLLLLALMAILLPGCGNKLSSHRTNEEGAAGVAGENKIYNLVDTGGADKHSSRTDDTKPSSPAPSAEAKAVSAETKIIKTAQLNFQVDSFEKSKKQISQSVEAENGYISNLEETDEGTRIRASYTIRVPAAGFDRLVENVLKQASYVSTSKIERKDVTEEYLDLKARMETEKLEEARIREILHQAKSIRDILEIETHLGGIREKIEAKEGRMKYLGHQAEYSTISATVYQTHPYARPPKSEDEKFFSRLRSSLGDGWTGLVEFIIFLITIWPVLIIIGIIIYFVLRQSKRKKQMNMSSPKKDNAVPPEMKK